MTTRLRGSFCNYHVTGKLLATFVLCVAANASATARRIYVEGVGDYSQGCHSGMQSLSPNSENTVTGFRDTLLASPNTFGLYTDDNSSWFNMDCWATDFFDPERTGDSDDDNNWFDASGVYASYYAGHGMCDACSGQYDCGTPCYHNSDCASPPYGYTNPGYCIRWPGDNFGRCNYTGASYRQLILANCTSGAAFHGGIVDYGYGMVKWGESQYQQNPGWAGAGTNGGAHLVVLDASCASMTERWFEVLPVFGGIHMLATTMVHSGDTASRPDRGPHFAAHYQANPYGSVADAWNDTINSETSHQNNYCHNRASSSQTATYFSGGGMGYNGCGAQAVTSWGTSSAEAHSLVSETWYDLQWDQRNASGASYGEIWYACNYDCYNWSFSLP